MEFLNRVCREVPRSAILLGTDRANIAAVIREALATPIAVGSPHSTSDWQSFITVIVHFPQENRVALPPKSKRKDPRNEFVVAVSGPGGDMTDEVAALPGVLRFFPHTQALANAEAWDRGIRESVAEVLLLVEPGDRLPSGRSGYPGGHHRNRCRGGLVSRPSYGRCQRIARTVARGLDQMIASTPRAYRRRRTFN
ncbi:MAG: hypothetical protein ABIZ80_11050 [Bryobacteraceae bacterium]